MNDLKRVVVIGSSGAGKSTFAKALASLLDCPHIELDVLHWEENWTAPVVEVFRARVVTAMDAPRWVVDGNYSMVRDLVWARATTVIWLNYALPIALWRVFWRSIRRALTGEVLFAGNRESLRNLFFSRKSLLWWVITTFKRRRRQFEILRAENEFPQLQWYEFSSPKQSARFLRDLKNKET